MLEYDDDLHEVFARSDDLVLACSLMDTTRSLIDEQVFRALPLSAVVVNVARGPVINTDGLLAALRGTKIRGATLDITDPEPLPSDHDLWDLENVLITPHNSGDTDKYWEHHVDILARKLERINKTDSYTDLENQVVTPEE